MTACTRGEASHSGDQISDDQLAAHQFNDGEFIYWESSIQDDYIVINAWLNKGWNTYSIYNTNLLGPLPTLISFESNDDFQLEGAIVEVGTKTKFDEESEGEIAYFEKFATFKQKISAISGKEFVIKGNVNYMICNETQCLPPADYNFELAIKP